MWKDIAYTTWKGQTNKNIKKIQKLIKKETGLDVNYNYIKSSIYKRKAKEDKIANKITTPKIYDNEYIKDWDGTQYIKIGIVSDTHIGSKHQQLTRLSETYDRFLEEGITDVYHAGDLTEGFKMRRGHEHEIFLMGADAQIEYVVANYPKYDSIKTHFIIGNHDLSHMISGGTDIGKRIAENRPDMNYVGALNSKIYLTPNCIMELNHPLDGASYALSYAIQKMADSYSGDAKPNILINGHHHKMLYCFYRNIHCIEAGTFEAQTPWMRGKRIAAHMGGLILHIRVDTEGTIKSFLPEFLPYYNEVKHDY